MNLSDPSGEFVWFIPALIALGTYATALLTAPDFQSDLFLLSQDIDNCDCGSAGLSGAAMLIPGLSAGMVKGVGKIGEALNITFKTEHVVAHVQELKSVGLTDDIVQAAIKSDIIQNGAAKSGEFIRRIISVGDKFVEYHQYGLDDSLINIGTYFLKK